MLTKAWSRTAKQRLTRKINNDIVKENGGFSRGLTEVAYFISNLPDVARTEESRRKGKTPKVQEWVSGSWACSEKLYDCHR